MRGKINDNLKALLLYVAITIALFLPAFLQQSWLIFGDNLYMHFPLRDYAIEQINQGEFPFWNPLIFGGFPLFANMQTGTLFPLNLLYFFFPAKFVFSFQIIICFVIASYGMFIYCKELTKSFFASFFSGIVFAFSGFMIFKMENLPIIQEISLIPYLIYFIEKSKDKYLSLNTLFAGLILAIQIFAGHPQICLYSIMLVISYQLFFCCSEYKDFIKIKKRVLNLVITIIIGLTISSVQLIPTFMLALSSSRINFNFQEFTFGSLHPLSILTSVFPYFFGGVISNGIYLSSIFNQFDIIGNFLVYVGILPIIFSFIALKYVKTDKYILFWLIAGAFGLFMALGCFNPIYKILYHIPIFNFFRYPEKYIIIYYLAVSILSSIGIHKIEQRKESEVYTFFKISGIYLFCIIISGICVYELLFNQNKTLYIPFFSFNYIIPVLVCLISFVSTYYFIKYPCCKTKIIIISVILVDLITLFGYFSGFQSYAKESSAFLNTEFKQTKYLQKNMTSTDRFITEFADKPLFIGEYQLLEPDYSMITRLSSVNGYDVLVPKRFLTIFNDLIIKNNNFTFNYHSPSVDLFNIKYFISRQINANKYLTDNNFLKNWSIGYLDDKIIIFSNKTELKPYRIFYKHSYINNLENKELNIKSLFKDNKNLNNVFIEDKYKKDIFIPRNIINKEYKISILDQSASKIRLLVNTKSTGILTTTNTYYYFWKAFVNNHKTDIFPVNINFIGLIVPKGKHIIELKIQDDYFNIGLIISTISALVVLITGIYLIKNK